MLQAIKSYHEILNIKEKHLDVPVLNALVVGFNTAKAHNMAENENVEKFRSKLLELFGRLTSQVTKKKKIKFLS